MTGPRRRERPTSPRDGIEELSQEDVERRILGLEGSTPRIRQPEPAPEPEAAVAAGLEAAAEPLAGSEPVLAPDAAPEAPGDAADELETLVAPRAPFESRGETPVRPVRARRSREAASPEPVATQRAEPRVRRLERDVRPITRRALLTRDASTLVAGGLLALLVGRVVAGGAAVLVPSPTPDESQVAVVGTDRPIGSFSQAPGVTLGAVVDASLGLDATPTLVPVITEPPRTPQPSGQTPGPGQTATPGPIATASAAFTCVPVGTTIECHASDPKATVWEWSIDDGLGTIKFTQDVVFDGLTSGTTYTVSLSVNNGQDTQSQQVTVP